ncbi:hypothetical protein Tco_1353980 [Tanacetum coccineum]
MQTAEDKVDSSKALDASLVDTESCRTSLKEQDTSSRSENDAHADDAYIRPIYDEEPMAEVQTTAKINIFATRQQHTKQPEFNNEGEVDQNAEQCHETCPLPAKLTDNQKTKLSKQSLESENIRLKKTVAQFQKDFLRMEAHCVNLELKYQNQALKEGQHGQFLKVKSNEAKVKHDIDVIETINIELEHKVAKLLKENKTLKRQYKEMCDSMKTTRAKNIEHTTSLVANNNKFKAQLQEKGLAIVALKNELMKLTGNSVNTKFAKLSILGKPSFQPRRNQSVVRQPTTFKSERPRFSKQQFASQVDVNNDLWVPTGKTFASSTTKVESEPPNGSNADIPNQCGQRTSSNVMQVHSEVQYIVQSYRGRTQSLVAKKKDISENRASRNFDLMIIKWRLLKITLQAPPQLGIQDHSNEQSSSKLVPKVVPLAVKTATSRQELELLFHLHIAMLRTTGQTVSALDDSQAACGEARSLISSLSSERDGLASEVSTLHSAFIDFKEKMEAQQEEQAQELYNRVAELEAHVMDVSGRLEGEFYPAYLTALAGRRWLLTHGMELAIVKCLKSPEYLGILGHAFGRAVDYGMQEGLAAGHEHGIVGTPLSAVVAYNPETAKNNYLDAIRALEEVDFPLVHLLKSKKDSGMDEVLDCFLLDGPLANLPEAVHLQPCLEQLSIPIYHADVNAVAGETFLSFALLNVHTRAEGAKKHAAALRQLMVDIVSHHLSSQNLLGQASTSAVISCIEDLDTDEDLGSVVCMPQFEDPCFEILP